MQAHEVRTAIVKGSVELNRMRQEIADVVSTLLSLLTPGQVAAASRWHNGLIQFSDGTRVWHVGRDGRETGTDRLVAACWIECSRPFHSSFPHYLALKNVQRVYDALPVFEQGMLDTFPHLEQELEPLARAAAAAQ